MRIEAVIFNWRGHEARAAALERQLGESCRVRIVNSEEPAEARHPHWEHIGESAYFAAQWQQALARFDGDVLLHVQADAASPHFASIVARCRDAMQRLDCGVYAPNVDYTPWTYRRALLTRVDEDLYEVPQTDCTCWAISREVLERAPRPDVARNVYGWGIDFLVIATARALGRRVLRDYRHTIDHVWNGAGYDTVAADRQARAMLASLPPETHDLVMQLRHEAASKLGPQPWPRRWREATRATARALRDALR